MADRIAKRAREPVRQAAAAPVRLFQGYDSVSGLGLNTALTGDSDSGDASSELRYRVCQDMSELAKALDVNQSLSVGFGPFGSVDEKMNFIDNLNVTTHSISIVVYARHGIGTETAINVRPRPDVEQPVGNDALAAFFLGYGDSYLAACTRGGEYFAVYTFYSQTREEKSQLELDMKAQGIFEVAKVDAALQVKLNSFTSSTKTRLSVEQRITGIRNPEAPPADKIIEFAQGFLSRPLDAPRVIHFETNGYERVPRFGTFQPIVRNRRFFVGNGIVDGLTASLVRVKQLQSQIRWLQDIHAFYGGYVDARLAEVTGQAQADLEAINGLINDYEDDPTRSFKAPKLPSLDAGSPSLAYSTGESPQFGPLEGAAFIDVDVVTDLARKTRVASLEIASGTRIDKLRVVYESATAPPRRVERGGGGGGWSNPLRLQAGQYVTRISGSSAGTARMRLQIDITDGRNVSGGTRTDGDGSFDWPVKEGFVLGFAGRASRDFLEQIAVVTCKLAPAKWTKTP
jgi:hypothetical protein